MSVNTKERIHEESGSAGKSDKSDKGIRGLITDISRCSLHDGPGVRTVVYFKGCGLRCKWCHNPETFTVVKDMMFLSTKCIKCGRCLEVCPQCHTVVDNEMQIDRSACKHCGRCVESCPAGALQMVGREVTVEEVMSEIRKDSHYYEMSSGGVTLSGGECLLQSEFAAALLEKCKEERIHTAIETALFVSWASVERVLPCVDLVYADLKLAEGWKHKEYTGQSNERILSNLKRLSEAGKQVIVRIPLIPGVNDAPDEIEKLGDVIGTLGSGVQAVEVLKYNYLAETKYQSIGLTWENFGKRTQSDEKLEHIRQQLKTITGLEII